MPLGQTPPDYHTSMPAPAPVEAAPGPPVNDAPETGKPTEDVQFTTVSFTTKTRAVSEAPAALSLYFPTILLAGQEAEFLVQLRNLGKAPLENLELGLASRAFEESLNETFPLLPGHESLRFPVNIKPEAPGQYVLQYSLKFQDQGQWKSYIGARVIWVNPVPEPGRFPLDPQRIKVNRGEAGANLKEILAEVSAPGGRPADAPIGSLAELRGVRLPEFFEPLDLSLDYQLSVSAEALSREQQSQQLIIPRLFVTNAQTGAKLKLTPTNPEAALGIHLVARPIFKIGRSRPDADLVSWFWPRNHANDERTRHLSRVHAVAERQEGRLGLRDNGSIGGSNFDGQPLVADKLEPLNRRATLILAGEYFLDVQPAPSSCGGLPAIKNLKLWTGPATAPVCPARGCVFFLPLNTGVAHHYSVWLFTDAAFGSSRKNPIALEGQGLAEIQGRFHHFRDAFWLENCAANDCVRINYYNLKANEIAPLISGQILQIGRTNYQVEVVA